MYGKIFFITIYEYWVVSNITANDFHDFFVNTPFLSLIIMVSCITLLFISISLWQQINQSISLIILWDCRSVQHMIYLFWIHQYITCIYYYQIYSILEYFRSILLCYWQYRVTSSVIKISFVLFFFYVQGMLEHFAVFRKYLCWLNDI